MCSHCTVQCPVIVLLISDHELANNGEDVLRTFATEEQKLFNRTFHKNEYFYCDGCKQYTFSNSSGACVGSKCSYLTLEKSRIYLGDFEKEDPRSKSTEKFISHIDCFCLWMYTIACKMYCLIVITKIKHPV